MRARNGGFDPPVLLHLQAPSYANNRINGFLLLLGVKNHTFFGANLRFLSVLIIQEPLQNGIHISMARFLGGPNDHFCPLPPAGGFGMFFKSTPQNSSAGSTLSMGLDEF